VRSLETRLAVTALAAAEALGTTTCVVQPDLDRLAVDGALRTSVLRCRPNAGTGFATRHVWYHTPEREVTARFGPLRTPDAQAPALAS
jgi:hypothetical protein